MSDSFYSPALAKTGRKAGSPSTLRYMMYEHLLQPHERGEPWMDKNIRKHICPRVFHPVPTTQDRSHTRKNQNNRVQSGSLKSNNSKPGTSIAQSRSDDTICSRGPKSPVARNDWKSRRDDTHKWEAPISAFTSMWFSAQKAACGLLKNKCSQSCGRTWPALRRITACTR